MSASVSAGGVWPIVTRDSVRRCDERRPAGPTDGRPEPKGCITAFSGKVATSLRRMRPPPFRHRFPLPAPLSPAARAAAVAGLAAVLPGPARAATSGLVEALGPVLLGSVLAGAAALGLWIARRRLSAGRRIAPPTVPGPDPGAAAAVTPSVQSGSGAPASTAALAVELDFRRRLSRDVYWEQDETGTITRVDDGPVPSPLRLRLGRRRWDDGAVPLGDPDWSAHRARIERREAFVEFVWVSTDPSGRVRVTIDSGLPRHDAAGRFVGYAGISREASAERIADRSRRLALASLLAATEPVLWIEAGPSGGDRWRVVWANAAACRLFDRTERELCELPCATLLGPDSQTVVAGVDAALRSRRESRLHGDIARRYGELRSVEVRIEPLPGDSALRPVAALLLHDRSADQARLREEGESIERLRTAMRERSNELEVTAKELESFIYTVSHDLRAPVRVIEGFARILQEDYGDRLDRIGHEHLHRVLGAAERMSRMIDALLGLSRLSAQPIVPETVDLSRVADLIVEELRAAEPQRQVIVSVQPGMVAEGDRTLLRVMLENLLGNAWKYSSKRPEARIEFSASGSGADTVYCVSDNGDGFDMRYADRLFGVFQRLHGASEFPGTGIGLATVQRIVRRHGGRVWAEAEPGLGARFRFTLGGPPAA